MTAVPFALDTAGNVMTPLTAPRDARYSCLECGAPLGVRRGEERRWHFYHLSGFKRECGSESVTHRAAKRLLAQALRRELEDTGHVSWQRRCAGADRPCPAGALLPRTFRPVGWTEVVEEVAHGDFRFDVAVVVGKRVLFGLEVLFRHAVPAPKAAALDVPWLELLAEDLIAHKPRVPVRGDEGAARCAACEERARLVAERARLLRERGQDDAVREAVTEAFEEEASRVAGVWAAVLHDARLQAKAGRAEQPRAQPPMAAPRPQAAARPPARPVEDEAALARQQAEVATRQRLRETVEGAGQRPGAQEKALDFALDYLTHYVPDFLSQVWWTRLFVGPCPACDAWGAWFDTGRVVPTTSPLVVREHPYAPWRNRCPVCGEVYLLAPPIGLEVEGSRLQQRLQRRRGT